MENTKIEQMFMDTLNNIISYFFFGVNHTSTIGSKWLANHTDLLTANQLEQVLFVAILLFTGKVIYTISLNSFTAFTNAFTNAFRSISRTKTKKAIRTHGIRSNLRTLSLRPIKQMRQHVSTFLPGIKKSTKK